MTTSAPPPWSLRRFRLWLNVAVIAVVAVSIGALGLPRLSPLALACTGIALVAWVCWAALPDGRPRDAALLVGALVGSAGVSGTDAILVAAVIAAVLTFTGFPTRPVAPGVVLAAVCALIVAVGATAEGKAPVLALASDAGILVALLVGLTRRQARMAEHWEDELRERALDSEREAARSRLLAERAAASRDIHDVLAHSLGGLVIQLDAVAALLEAGRADEAGARVDQARRLAGDGLAEARRAVAALRDPGSTEPAPSPDAALEDLVETHRTLGADVVVQGDLGLDGLDGAHRDALIRMVQEALSNARRHSPGATSRVTVDRGPGWRTVAVTTPETAAPAAPGGGHGLVGMRERFAALGDGSTVSAGRVGDAFVVTGTVAG